MISRSVGYVYHGKSLTKLFDQTRYDKLTPRKFPLQISDYRLTVS